nr:dynamin family protein [uncultured Lachnoanaerobaculum sp.]
MIDNNIVLYNNSGNVLYKFKLPYFKFINSVNKILPYLDEKQRIYIKRELERLKCRLDDNSLYLGTVGSFSSGKSTFLNSILHKNLLPTDAIQGTTVTTSILKRSDIDDLDIVYTDGSRKIFSQNKCDLIKEYFGGSEELSYDNDFELQVELFKKLISVEEIGKKVNYVTFYYKNEHMPNGIALVDTPGTESLNSRHNEVTKNAIDNICDAIVVVIPQEKPVSEDLIDYINTNLEKQKQELIFAVTKVELLGDKDELPMLMKNIKKRLEKGIDIEVKNVIPMPTFVYLKEVDNEMKANIKAINGMPEDERIEMMKLYEDGIEKIKNILENNRVRYINKRAMNISDNIANSINNMISLRIKKEEEEKKKYKKSIMPVEKFRELAVERLEQFRRNMKKRLSDEIQNINKELDRKKLEMQTTSKTCKKLKDIDKVFDFEKIFSNYRVEKYEDISKKLLVEAEFEYNNAFMCNREKLLAEYSCCGVKEISINNDADVFWSFADSELERVKNICNGAKKQALLELEAFANKAGKGLSSWGFTLKYVFSETKTVKSIARDFEVIVTKMIDTISLTMTEFLTTEISAIIDRNTDIGKENILYLLKYNKSDIEKYTEKREQILNNTNSDTRVMEKAMVSINKYNNIIKEAN